MLAERAPHSHASSPRCSRYLRVRLHLADSYGVFETEGDSLKNRFHDCFEAWSRALTQFFYRFKALNA